MAGVASSDGLISRGVPWAAAVALHGVVGGLLALAPAPLPPVPPDVMVVEVALVADPPPDPQPPPAPPLPAPPIPAAPAPAAVPDSPLPPVRPVVRPAARPAPPVSVAPALAAAPVAPMIPAAAPPPPPPTAAAWDGGGLVNPPPVYPRAARLAGQEGRVVVRVQVAADGSASSVHVVTSSGTEALDAAAVRAVRGWQFRPATRHGQPVADAVEVPVVFRLRG
jgi:protein TonB